MAAIATEETSDATEETQQAAAETELDAIPCGIAPLHAPLTADSFYRAQQPLHPSWQALLFPIQSDYMADIVGLPNAKLDAATDSIEETIATEQQPLFSLTPNSGY